jgi:hypothetical protein
MKNAEFLFGWMVGAGREEERFQKYQVPYRYG